MFAVVTFVLIRCELCVVQELERALREFVAMPTVSCDPSHRDDCWRGAKFLGTLLESLGEGDSTRARPMGAISIRSRQDISFIVARPDDA